MELCTGEGWTERSQVPNLDVSSAVNYVGQWFSNLNMHQNHLEGLLKT